MNAEQIMKDVKDAVTSDAAKGAAVVTGVAVAAFGVFVAEVWAATEIIDWLS